MLSTNPESMKRDTWLVLAIFAVVFAVHSWIELKYLFYGKIASGTIIETHQYTESTKSGRHEMLAVVYQFTESSGVARTDMDRVPLSFRAKFHGQKVDIEYRPGEAGGSRLAGQSDFLSIYACITLVFGGLGGFISYQVWCATRPDPTADARHWQHTVNLGPGCCTKPQPGS